MPLLIDSRAFPGFRSEKGNPEPFGLTKLRRQNSELESSGWLEIVGQNTTEELQKENSGDILRGSP